MSAINYRNPRSDGAAPEAAAPSETPRRNPLLVLWYRRWIVVICLVISMAAALVYLQTATPIYESSARILVEQNTPRIMANDPGGAGVNTAQSFLWTQCTVIQSRDFLQMVAQEPGIREMQSFLPGRDVGISLGRMVSATVGRRDDVITVSVRSEVKEDAHRIANAVVEAFIRFHDKTKRSIARDVLAILQEKSGQIDKELSAKRLAMADFQTKHANLVLGDERTNPAAEQAARLRAAQLDMQLQIANAEASYNLAKGMMGDPAKIRQLLDSQQFKSETAEFRQQMRSLQERLVMTNAVAGESNPQLQGLMDNIRRLKQEMEAEDRKNVEAYVAQLEAQLNGAKLTLELITKLLAEKTTELQKFQTVAAQYALLRSEVEGIEGFNKVIDENIKRLSLTEDSGARIRPVEMAVLSSVPVEPNRKSTLTMALLLGGVLGALLAFIRDWMDQRLRSAEEIKQVLGLPVLGVVPHIAELRTASQRGQLLHHDPMSDVAEAYRTVRTAVYFGQSGGIAKTLLVTSPSPGDGKTTLAANLAIAMAQAGNRILLLDADFRKPSQHKIFEIDKRIGLSSVLAGQLTLQEAIHVSAVPGLDILPCGPIPANPSEILNSQAFADILAELTAKYDHVLLDSPPIMPVTDARILAASCDATVLALCAERSTRKGAIYSRDMLHSVGSQILGVVVNDVPRRKGVYGYYYTYGEQYQYGYGNRRPATTATAASPEVAAPPALPGPGPVKKQA